MTRFYSAEPSIHPSVMAGDRGNPRTATLRRLWYMAEIPYLSDTFVSATIQQNKNGTRVGAPEIS